MNRTPLVTCLCTSTNRLHYLKNAVNRFAEQSYPNKELLVVSANYDAEYEAFLTGLSSDPGRITYKWMEVEEKVTLGEIRNFALKHSDGEYFCVWDDDDWYHYKRIEIQMKEASRNRKMGAVLAYCILYDVVNETASMSRIVCPPASILCKKSALGEDLFYAALDRGEDSVFMNNLFVKNLLYPISRPDLYIYIKHGSNTSPQPLFDKFVGVRFSEKLSVIIGDIVKGEYSKEKAAKLLRGDRFLREMDYLIALASNPETAEAVVRNIVLNEEPIS